MRTGSTRQTGNTLLLSVMIIGILAAMAVAQYTVVQRNMQASNYFLAYGDLHKYAESGLDLAVHEVRYGLSPNAGMIGTIAWSAADDVGRDGKPSTQDKGEGDGVPTYGEPNIVLQPVGPAGLKAGLFTYVAPTVYPTVQRVIATVQNGAAISTVESLLQKTDFSIPRVGAAFVDPGVALNMSASFFYFDGRDHSTSWGLLSSLPAKSGIATALGDNAGDNLSALMAQIPVSKYPRVLGLGSSASSPSVGEYPDVDLPKLIDRMKGAATHTLAPGSYWMPRLGNITDDIRITYAPGDVVLSGLGSGGGVLVVDGDLKISGGFFFKGLILVRGDVVIQGVEGILGSLMVTKTIDIQDDASLTGNSLIFYSSQVLDRVQPMLPPNYSLVYYTDL